MEGTGKKEKGRKKRGKGPERSNGTSKRGLIKRIKKKTERRRKRK